MKKGVFSHLSHIPPSLAFPRSAVCLSLLIPPFFPEKRKKKRKGEPETDISQPGPTPPLVPTYSTCAPFLLAVPCSRRRDRASVFLYPTSSSRLYRLGGPFLTMLKGGIRQLIMCIVLEGRTEWGGAEIHEGPFSQLPSHQNQPTDKDPSSLQLA